MIIRFAIIYIFFLSGLNAQEEGGLLHVTLGVENGHLIIAESSLENADTYPTDALNQLEALLHQSFIMADSIIRLEGDLQCQAGYCEDYLLLTSQDGIAEEVVDAYFEQGPTWPLKELFEQFLFGIMQREVLNGSPIAVGDLEFEEEDYDFLELTIPVRPPIFLDKLHLIWMDEDTLNYATKERILGDLNGQLFYEAAIRKRLSDYYFRLNFQPEYLIDLPSIRVLPHRIARFIVTTREEAEVDKIAYLLLPNDLFKAFIQVPKADIRIQAEENKFIYNFNILNHYQQRTQALPIVDFENLALFQTQLGQLSYLLDTRPTLNAELGSVAFGEQFLYVDLKANQIDIAPDSTNVPPSTPNLTRDNSFSDGLDNRFGQRNAQVSDSSRLTTLKRNYIGFGIDYNFNDERRLKAVYRRLFRNGINFFLQFDYSYNEAGISEGGLSISGNYSHDYLFFNKLKKRLLVRLSAGTNFTANRIIMGTAIKERRNSAEIYTEIDWLKNQPQSLLQSSLKIADEDIALNTFEEVPFANTNIFSSEWRNIFYRANSPLQFNKRFFKIENTLKVGWSAFGNAMASQFFSTGSINLNFNQQIARGLFLDINAQGVWSSAQTPIFEQAGHRIATNRGFPDDTVIGRNLVGTRVEWWFPFPILGKKDLPINTRFFKNIYIALLGDYTQYSEIIGQTNNIDLWSYGLGLRLKFPTARINLNWALRKSELDNFRSGSQFSVDLVVNTPFL